MIEALSDGTFFERCVTDAVLAVGLSADDRVRARARRAGDDTRYFALGYGARVDREISRRVYENTCTVTKQTKALLQCNQHQICPSKLRDH